MTQIQINEDFLLTTTQVGEMLGITRDRARMLAERSDFAIRSKGGSDRRGNYKIRFGDLGKLQELHERTKAMGRTRMSLAALTAAYDELKEQVDFLMRYAVLDEDAQVDRTPSVR